LQALDSRTRHETSRTDDEGFTTQE
jgi:hypothetical protein